MISSFQSRRVSGAGWWAGRLAVVAVMGMAVALAGCDDKKKDKVASQTAAKVNKEEITVHQINFVLQQQRGLKPEQADAASRQILERLIDQEVVLQKAEDQRLDRDPRVVQQVEAARREIIARAYAEKAGEPAAKPTAEEVKKYYEDNPALFSARRVYSLQELSVEAAPEQLPVLREQLRAAKSLSDFIEYLKANNFRFSGNQSVRAAEQLPLNLLNTYAKLNTGQALLLPSANGAQVVVMAGSRSEPVDETRAKPAIEQFLLNDARRKLLEADMKSLRAAAKIQYVGKFAEAAASAAPAASTPAASSASAASAASAVVSGASMAAAPVASAAASTAALDASSIRSGLGFK